jgi:3-oxoacyl-[acyl-carrier-protein] synthase III
LCDAYIQSGKAQKILMVGAETQSRFFGTDHAESRYSRYLCRWCRCRLS